MTMDISETQWLVIGPDIAEDVYLVTANDYHEVYAWAEARFPNHAFAIWREAQIPEMHPAQDGGLTDIRRS